MGNGGGNCGMIWPPDGDVSNATCACGTGYVNEEGTGITGPAIAAGQALDKQHYLEHRGCRTCAADPSQCEWRLNHLKQPQVKVKSLLPAKGSFEFFVPSSGIDKEVMEAFLKFNAGGFQQALRTGQRFLVRYLIPHNIFGDEDPDIYKGQPGFCVESSFRFNIEDIRQLQDLTLLRKDRLDWRRSLKRKATSISQPFTEFTRYVSHTTTWPSDTSGKRKPSEKRAASPTRSPHSEQERANRADRQTESEPATRPGVKDSQYISDDDDLAKTTRLMSVSTGSQRYGSPGTDSTSQSSMWDDLSEPRDRRFRDRPLREETPRPEYSRHESHDRQVDRSADRGTTYISASRQQPQATDRHGNRDEEPEKEAPAASDRETRKFFVPAANIDVVVLAFYLKQGVDAGAQVVLNSYNGKPGFVIEAKRVLDRDELEDIISDTKKWEQERRQRKLPGNAYPQSDTASQRKKKLA